MNGEREYIARLVPIGRFTRVDDRKLGPIYERFSEHAFRAARMNPTSVAVEFAHEGPYVVGRCLKFDLDEDGWLRAHFVLNSDPPGRVARAFARVGTPLSVEFEPGQTEPLSTRDGLRPNHITYDSSAELLSVNLVESAVYRDAGIVEIVKRDDPRTPLPAPPPEVIERLARAGVGKYAEMQSFFREAERRHQVRTTRSSG